MTCFAQTGSEPAVSRADHACAPPRRLPLTGRLRAGQSTAVPHITDRRLAMRDEVGRVNGRTSPVRAMVQMDIGGEVVAVGDRARDVPLGSRVVVDPTQGCGLCRSCNNGERAYCERLRV